MGVRILNGDSLRVLQSLPSESVHCCVTSPPYWGLRDYGHAGQLGLEATPQQYVENLVEVFREVKRVLRDDGTLWLNLGDSYATGAGKAASPGGGAQGARFIESGPSGYGGDRGEHMGKASYARSQVPDGKNPAAGVPTFQPNRMPIDGLKPKDLVGIPWRVAFALQADGWYLRQDIIWHKPNPMPESVRDRCTKAHEYLFLLAKSEKYYFDSAAMQEPTNGAVPGNKTHKGVAAYEAGDEKHRTKAGLLAYSFKRQTATTPPPGQPPQHREDREDVAYVGTRNKRSVWTVTTKPFKGAHFATFPPDLIEPCVLAGCPEGGTVLDPFGGSGTTGLVAQRCGRDAILIELNPEYAAMAQKRILGDAPLFAEVA